MVHLRCSRSRSNYNRSNYNRSCCSSSSPSLACRNSRYQFLTVWSAALALVRVRIADVCFRYLITRPWVSCQPRRYKSKHNYRDHRNSNHLAVQSKQQIADQLQLSQYEYRY